VKGAPLLARDPGDWSETFWNGPGREEMLRERPVRRNEEG
jgi:hypothetical protein